VHNPLNGPRAIRAIALVFLVLILVGVVAGLVHSFTNSSAGTPGPRTVTIEPAPQPTRTTPQR
jgi:hypothetical protein